MTYADFYFLLANDWQVYACFLMIMLAFYYLLLRKQVWNVFDPLFLSFVTSAFASTVVFFLYSQNSISSYYFYNFIFTEIAFLGGFSLFGLSRRRQAVYSPEADPAVLQLSLSKIALVLSAAFFLAAQLTLYWLFGIPALSEEGRLNQYMSHDAVSGVMDKIVPVTRIFSVWFSIHIALFTQRAQWRVLAVLILLVVCATYLLSGAKSSIVELIFILFIYRWWFAGSLTKAVTAKMGKTMLRLLGVAVVLAGLVLLIRSSLAVRGAGGIEADGFLAVSGGLFARLIQSGDIFILAYPNDVLNSIHSPNFLAALFPGIFGKLMGVPAEDLEPLGGKLAAAAMGFELQEAPNSRHNVFGLLLFGPFGSVVYSLLLGMLLGFVSRRLYGFVSKKTSVIGALFAAVYLAISQVETDANIAAGQLVGVATVGVGVIFLAELLHAA